MILFFLLLVFVVLFFCILYRYKQLAEYTSDSDSSLVTQALERQRLQSVVKTMVSESIRLQEQIKILTTTAVEVDTLRQTVPDLRLKLSKAEQRSVQLSACVERQVAKVSMLEQQVKEITQSNLQLVAKLKDEVANRARTIEQLRTTNLDLVDELETHRNVNVHIPPLVSSTNEEDVEHHTNATNTHMNVVQVSSRDLNFNENQQQQKEKEKEKEDNQNESNHISSNDVSLISNQNQNQHKNIEQNDSALKQLSLKPDLSMESGDLDENQTANDHETPPQYRQPLSRPIIETFIIEDDNIPSPSSIEQTQEQPDNNKTHNDDNIDSHDMDDNDDNDDGDDDDDDDDDDDVDSQGDRIDSTSDLVYEINRSAIIDIDEDLSDYVLNLFQAPGQNDSNIGLFNAVTNTSTSGLLFSSHQRMFAPSRSQD